MNGRSPIAHVFRHVVAIIVAWLAVGSSGHAAAPANRSSVADTVVASPDVSHETSFAINCSEATWRKVLDNPWLMGQLWNVYGYAPSYKIRPTSGGFHVDDPTGLEGDLWDVPGPPHERRYLAVGRITLRALPFFNSGQGVVILRSQATGPQIRATLQVYIRADRAISRAVLWAGKPLLQRKVESRIKANVYDGVRLVERIASSPDMVLRRLQGPAAETFRAVFVPPVPSPPTRPKGPLAPSSAPRR